MRRMILVGVLVVACARPVSAELLTITSVHVDSGTVVVGYGGLAEVLYDSLGMAVSPCGIAMGCDAISFAGGMWGSSYTFVRPLLAPIAACTYEVIGTFTLGGTVYSSTAPLTFAFVFDAPSMILPLPTFAPVPALQPGSPLPWQSTFVVQAIDVTRTTPERLTPAPVATPEPGVWILLVCACLPLVFLRPKPDRRSGGDTRPAPALTLPLAAPAAASPSLPVGRLHPVTSPIAVFPPSAPSAVHG